MNKLIMNLGILYVSKSLIKISIELEIEIIELI